MGFEKGFKIIFGRVENVYCLHDEIVVLRKKRKKRKKERKKRKKPIVTKSLMSSN